MSVLRRADFAAIEQVCCDLQMDALTRVGKAAALNCRREETAHLGGQYLLRGGRGSFGPVACPLIAVRIAFVKRNQRGSKHFVAFF